jgi:hypothetical protein
MKKENASSNSIPKSRLLFEYGEHHPTKLWEQGIAEAAAQNLPAALLAPEPDRECRAGVPPPLLSSSLAPVLETEERDLGKWLVVPGRARRAPPSCCDCDGVLATSFLDALGEEKLSNSERWGSTQGDD